MKPRLNETALMLQEARRRNRSAFLEIAAQARLPVWRIQALARGESEPTPWEKQVLDILARG